MDRLVIRMKWIGQMSKASCSATFEFPDLLGKLQNARERIEKTIAATIQTQVGLRFDSEGSHNGHEKWDPLVMREGQILTDTGTLRKSMSPPQKNGTAGSQGFVRSSGPVENILTEVGTNVAYASAMDYGAIIVPTKKMALRFKNNITGKYVFAKQVIIPPRPFTDLNDTDIQELNDTLGNLILDILENS